MIVGVDTGGTFTDLVLVEGDEIRVHKLPSTPDDPSRAVLEGLRELLGDDLPQGHVVHGSTVATNALLERKGAVVALVTTAGFEDVIEIGRQARGAIYDLAVEKPEPLVPPERRVGTRERLDERGGVVTPLDADEVARAVEAVRGSGAGAVAVCFLHAYANPEHERAVAAALREALPEAFVTASHEVLPEFREYERTSTTAVNAFVGPVMTRYLGKLGERLDPDRVRIMTSGGGVVSLEAAGRLAVQTILSGPAGGAVGGFEIGRRAGHDHVITFDMGGTSTDVSLCPGALTRTSETEIGGLPIRVPAIDIHTVGAGGGSIAFRDPGGSLKVGPRSAGARPGPICYGRGGTEPTVTDANLFLGRLSPEHFLGGTRALEEAEVAPALEALADELGLGPEEAAEGIVRVANATMERAIRVISLERGFDPRDFTLVCFGGAGGLHAADLAAALGIPRVLVPRGAGTLSALGMLMADPIRDFARTVMAPTDRLEPGALEEAFAELEARGREELVAEGVREEALRFERLADVRYVGQGFELDVRGSPAGPGALAARFHERHERRYGYADPGRPTEIVTLRVRATATTEKPPSPSRRRGGPDASAAALGARRIMHGGAAHEGALVDRERLRPGHVLEGPAVIVEYSTTTLLPPGTRCEVDERDNLVLSFGERA